MIEEMSPSRKRGNKCVYLRLLFERVKSFKHTWLPIINGQNDLKLVLMLNYLLSFDFLMLIIFYFLVCWCLFKFLF